MADMLTAVERLGGWAVVSVVVVWVGRWMMKRADRALDALDRVSLQLGSVIQQFHGTRDDFYNFEVEEKQTHRSIIQTQERIAQSLEHQAATTERMASELAHDLQRLVAHLEK